MNRLIMNKHIMITHIWKVVLVAGLIACGSEQKDEQKTETLSSGGGSPLDLGAVTVVIPEGWQSQLPSSSMRKAQFALPRQEGDTEDAEVVVFYFGTGSAGSVEANLQRWRGQMKGAEGDTKKSVANGMPVTTLDVTGSYASSMGPMMKPGEDKPNYRMIASIIESPAGAYYFKLTGPQGTVAHWQPAFETYIQSMRAE